MRTITSILIFFSVLLIGFALSESVGRIENLYLAQVSPELFDSSSHDIHYAKNPALMYIHVIAGIIFLLTGAFQLIAYFRRNYLRAHRVIGKVFLTISFVVSISAIILGLFFPFGNRIETFSNLVFGSFILYSTIMAYTTIKQKKVIEHWVRRVYFVSLAIATIRVVMITIIISTGQNIKEVMGISFLIGFSLHLAIIELWIYKHKKRINYNKSLAQR